MFGIPTEVIAKITITETTDTVTLPVNPLTIAALSYTPRHLVARMNFKQESSNNSSHIQFNRDTGSNYNRQHMAGSASTASGGRGTNGTGIHIGQGGSDANQFLVNEILMPDALSTRSHKTTISLNNAAEASVQVITGRWANTAAITSVTMFTEGSGIHYSAGSTFELCVVDETFNLDQDGDGEQILTGTASGISVGSIGAADGDLVVIGSIRGDRSARDTDSLEMHYNSDTTSGNYYRQRLYGTGTTVATSADNDDGFGKTTGASATASAFSAFLYTVPNYSDGSNDRTALSLTGLHADSGQSDVYLETRRWDNTAGITAFNLMPEVGSNFIAGSMLSTYVVPKGLIERQELSGTASSVAFTSIPQTYDHLELTAYIRDDRSATSDDILMSLTPVGGSSDTTDANYDRQLLQGSSTTVTAAQSAADRAIGNIPAASETANVFGALTITLYNYTKTDRHKHSLSVSGRSASASGMYIRSNRWENTAAIEAITLTPSAGTNFVAGTVVSLRGINSTVAAAATDIETINGIASSDIEAVN